MLSGQGGIRIVDISDRVHAARPEVERFLEQLGPELTYLGSDFGIDKILDSQQVLIAESQGVGVVAVYGSSSKYGMTQEFIVVRRPFHGRGLGRAMVSHATEFPGRNLLLAVVDRRNAPSLSLFLKKGYRKIGRRWELEYLVKPLNFRGMMVSYLVQMAFPLVRIVDRIRGAK